MKRQALILLEGNTSDIGHLYVQAARTLGLHPISLTTGTGSHDHLAAENVETLIVDTNDPNALIEAYVGLDSSYDLVGITAAREEVYIPFGKVCRHFGLPGPDPAAIQRCCDKLAQIECLSAAGVPVPAFRLATTATDVERCAAEIGLPLILKPTVGSSSIGVRLCRDTEELSTHIAHLFAGGYAWSSDPKILIQSYADGPWFSINTMGTEVVAIATADFWGPPHFVFRDFTCPATLSNKDYTQMAEIARRCMEALDLTWGPGNVEVRLTKTGPVVIEVNPRLAGVPDPQLIQLAYGIDLPLEFTKLCIGLEPDLHRKHLKTAASRFLVAEHEGTLEWINGEGIAAELPNVSEVKLYVAPQDNIVIRGDHRDIIGHVITAAATRQRAEDTLEQAVEFIKWSIRPSPDRSGSRHAAHTESDGQRSQHH